MVDQATHDRINDLVRTQPKEGVVALFDEVFTRLEFLEKKAQPTEPAGVVEELVEEEIEEEMSEIPAEAEEESSGE